MKTNEFKTRKRRVKVKLVCSILLLVLGICALVTGGAGIAYEGQKDTMSLSLLLPVLIFITGVALTVGFSVLLPYKLFPFWCDEEGDLLRKELKNRDLGGKG